MSPRVVNDEKQVNSEATKKQCPTDPRTTVGLAKRALSPHIPQVVPDRQSSQDMLELKLQCSASSMAGAACRRASCMLEALNAEPEPETGFFRG